MENFTTKQKSNTAYIHRDSEPVPTLLSMYTISIAKNELSLESAARWLRYFLKRSESWSR